MTRPAALTAALPTALVALLLAGCTADGGSSSKSQSQSPGGSSGAAAITDVATGLEAPWSVVPMDDGTAFVGERDSGTVLEMAADGTTRTAGTIDGVVHQGEGGLLGLALLPGDPTYLYAYETTPSDNRIVRMPLEGVSGSWSLGPSTTVLTGLAKAQNHDGGRIAFGPDGMLYATVGDASNPEDAQDPDSRNGKILRVTPTGEVPDDNPTQGSPVWSMGHRNPQGLTWDSEGRMWAAEFGQNTYDELNLIEPGNNYGWPDVEGKGDTDGRYTNPIITWTTDEASPSGLVSIGDKLYLAGLGGERLWVIDPDSRAASARFEGELGRIRDVAAGPDGTLWMLTNNTDGRGSPRAGDDRLVSVPLP